MLRGIVHALGNNYLQKWRSVTTTFIGDAEVNNCFRIYHTSEKAGCKIIVYFRKKDLKILFNVACERRRICGFCRQK